MSKPVKVYNKGTRPVVFKRDRTGVEAIHPGKFLTFNAKKGNAIIGKFDDACSEEDYKKILEAEAKKKEEDQKKAKAEAKKKAKEAKAETDAEG